MKRCHERGVDPRFLAPEELWHAGELLLPEEPPKPKGGRPPEDDAALFKVCYGVRTGIHWKALPRCWEASSTVHARVQQCSDAGGFPRLCTGTLGEDNVHPGLQGLWQGLDGAMTKAPPGGKAPGLHPTDRGKRDTKRHGRTQGAGLPISACGVTGAKRHDKTQVERTHRGLNRGRRILIRREKKVENYMAFLQIAAAHLCMRAGLAVGGGAIPSEVSGEALKHRLTAGISRKRASNTGVKFPPCVFSRI